MLFQFILFHTYSSFSFRSRDRQNGTNWKSINVYSSKNSSKIVDLTICHSDIPHDTLTCQIWYHWRIQEFILGSQTRSPIESWGRSPNRGREAPEYIEGEARVEIWGRSPNRGRSPRKSGGGVWGGCSGSPSPENFWKIKLETIYFGAYLKQLFEMTNEMV